MTDDKLELCNRLRMEVETLQKQVEYLEKVQSYLSDGMVDGIKAVFLSGAREVVEIDPDKQFFNHVTPLFMPLSVVQKELEKELARVKSRLQSKTKKFESL